LNFSSRFKIENTREEELFIETFLSGREDVKTQKLDAKVPLQMLLAD